MKYWYVRIERGVKTIKNRIICGECLKKIIRNFHE